MRRLRRNSPQRSVTIALKQRAQAVDFETVAIALHLELPDALACGLGVSSRHFGDKWSVGRRKEDRCQANSSLQ